MQVQNTNQENTMPISYAPIASCVYPYLSVYTFSGVKYLEDTDCITDTDY